MAIDEAQAMRLLVRPGLYSIVTGPYGPGIYSDRPGEECLVGHLQGRLTARWRACGFLVEQEDTRGCYMLATRLASAEGYRRRFGTLPPLSTLKRTMASVQITTMLDALCIDHDLPTAFQIQVPRLTLYPDTGNAYVHGERGSRRAGNLEEALRVLRDAGLILRGDVAASTTQYC
jgi:hypothetical protein